MVLSISWDLLVSFLTLSSSDLLKFLAKSDEKFFLTLKFPKVHKKGPRELDKKQIETSG